MERIEPDSEGTMKESKKPARIESTGNSKNHLISSFFLLVIVFLFTGLAYSGSDDALFIDQAGNVKLQKGEPVNEFSNDGNLEGNSDLAVPTEKAVKTYVDTKDKKVRTYIDNQDEAVRTYIDTKDRAVRAHIQDQIKQNNKTVVKNITNHLLFDECGGRYLCTPRACLEKCKTHKMRMATYSEVYAWALAGKDWCAWMWMLHPEKKVVKAYPMYFNRTTSGCGEINTGDFPRMIVDKSVSWNSGEKANCACSSLEYLR